ncbi:hypothetical protein [Phytohabitans kaempferiae]|uniref:Uncharacterized protein n=1 Tax=Phytohabitans kaempferiae TaxID=1620943 RepID=A0ABV6LYK5_9ACTN
MTERVERGAQEEMTGTPMTETEERAMRRPASEPEGDSRRRAEAVRDRADAPGPVRVDEPMEDPPQR